MSARDRILQRLRAAAPAVPPALPVVPQTPAPASGIEAEAARLALFVEKMSFWRGEIVKVTRTNWTERLRELCAAKGVNSLLYGPDGLHGPALTASAIPGLRAYQQPANTWKTELFTGIDAGFTSTRGAIAETGTLIVWPDATEPRLLSLVPPIHFALLDARQIHGTLLEAMRAQRWNEQMPTNALLVSGPSKTADIQQTLAYGAHGPKELVILLLVDEEEAQ